MLKTLIKTVSIPRKCVIIKRGQLLLLPQVMEVSESIYYESFALLALFLLHWTTLSLRPLLQLLSSLLLLSLSFSSPSPLSCSGITSSDITHWHYILMAGRGVFMLAYIPWVIYTFKTPQYNCHTTFVIILIINTVFTKLVNYFTQWKNPEP